MINLQDMLLVEAPVVMNYLLDQANVESVLLCPHLEEAMYYMQQQDRYAHQLISSKQSTYKCGVVECLAIAPEW